MNRLALTALLLFAAPIAARQPGAANREAMKKLDFLVGKWKGDATVTTGPKETKVVKQTEDIQFKLDGTVLVVEGIGRGKVTGKDEDGILFQALGVMSYDAQAKKYKVKAYRGRGAVGRSGHDGHR